jgi:hypothetical protein
MPGQQTCAPPVIVTLPARLDADAAAQAADQITAAFTPGVSVVIADLTAAARCDRSAIRNLLKAHRKATARGRQLRFAIRPGGPLHQITGFAGTHPLLAVYPTLQHAMTGQSPIPGQGDTLLQARAPGRRDSPRSGRTATRACPPPHPGTRNPCTTAPGSLTDQPGEQMAGADPGSQSPAGLPGRHLIEDQLMLAEKVPPLWKETAAPVPHAGGTVADPW